MTAPGYVFQYFDCKVPNGLSDDVLARRGPSSSGKSVTTSTTPASVAGVQLGHCPELNKVAFLGFAKDLGNHYASRHLGVTVDQKRRAERGLHSAFARIGIAKWVLYHRTNIILPSLFEDTVRQAVDMREAGQFNKVCEWTVNKPDSIETLMTIGIDAICAIPPTRCRSVAIT